MFQAIREQIKRFFYFSTREANGLCCLLLLIALLVIAPQAWQLYAPIFSAKQAEHSRDVALLESYLRLLHDNASKKVRIDINTATVQQLSAIEGIAEKSAITLMRYRHKLGGFVSVDQYKEIYGLTDRARVKLKACTMVPATFKPKQLSLNHATFQELVAHPYISFAKAKAMIRYRQQQGKFTTLAELQALPGYHTDWATKIMPYLSLL
ncbi:MAG: helix-hairpin-helix domain-containing protein [Candidatus Cardinium sp.]|nr:helix-hairpin-helix domain-containing protein [Candidatus Cardinium sp.]